MEKEYYNFVKTIFITFYTMITFVILTFGTFTLQELLFSFWLIAILILIAQIGFNLFMSKILGIKINE